MKKILKKILKFIIPEKLKVKLSKKYSSFLPDEFQNILSNECLYKLLTQYKFDNVLDIGVGQGLHTNIFLKYQKKVTAIDFGNSHYFVNNSIDDNVELIIADYLEYSFNTKFDCIWCSHVLEHTTSPHLFLKKIFLDLKEGGILAITVPSEYRMVVGGHLNIFSAGHLIYQLILAGFSCDDVSIKTYGFNISIILKKKSIDFNSVRLIYDCGEIKNLYDFLPRSLKFSYSQDGADYYYNSSIKKLNW